MQILSRNFTGWANRLCSIENLKDFLFKTNKKPANLSKETSIQMKRLFAKFLVNKSLS